MNWYIRECPSIIRRLYSLGYAAGFYLIKALVAATARTWVRSEGIFFALSFVLFFFFVLSFFFFLSKDFFSLVGCIGFCGFFPFPFVLFLCGDYFHLCFHALFIWDGFPCMFTMFFTFSFCLLFVLPPTLSTIWFKVWGHLCLLTVCPSIRSFSFGFLSNIPKT